MSNADDLFGRRAAENARALAEAEADALESGKEAFERARLEELLGYAPGGLAEREQALRKSYYLVNAKIRTLAEFAAIVRANEPYE